MEPDLIGQEKRGHLVEVWPAGEASMEPDLIGQEKLSVNDIPAFLTGLPQWSLTL